ncbi:NAD kinase [Pararhizobium mangrovi]|uniref:NAD kinase n=1 Tax=Pararhizobium mangrovi TaxID=2590452 RepID=A0A506UCW6_9HYPH|nr:NAD kinase [Pararhizobium mangrovi]TPW29587.1 NAD kinase [Pararhizobium mangrovi]
MKREIKSLSFIASGGRDAREAARHLASLYGNAAPSEADVIVALGGDGFMLQMLHETMNTNRLVYGMNRGSVGFLMNHYAEENLRERIADAVENIIRPLEMHVVDSEGEIAESLAINEVALFRQSYQACKLRITVDGQQRMEELVCDGVMVATPAGSTAYNLSAHGPILPLDAPLLALTPVSAFRPRRWRGALLPNRSIVEIEVLEPVKRPVNAVADHTETKSVRSVRIAESPTATARILSDPNHTWADRILAEQFMY